MCRGYPEEETRGKTRAKSPGNPRRQADGRNAGSGRCLEVQTKLRFSTCAAGGGRDRIGFCTAGSRTWFGRSPQRQRLQEKPVLWRLAEQKSTALSLKEATGRRAPQQHAWSGRRSRFDMQGLCLFMQYFFARNVQRPLTELSNENNAVEMAPVGASRCQLHFGLGSQRQETRIA